MHRYPCVLFMDWCSILIVKTVRNQFTSALKQIATLYSICILGPDAWKLNKQSCRLKVSESSSGSTPYIKGLTCLYYSSLISQSSAESRVEAYIDCAIVYTVFVTFLEIFLKLLVIILLFDSPVSVKDQARIRIIYFNVISMFFFLFLAKRLGWRHWCRKTGQCIKSPSAMYVVEVISLHQERKFLHYCWAARRRTFTKNFLFSAALLYLDTWGQCSHSSPTPSMASHSCTTY